MRRQHFGSFMLHPLRVKLQGILQMKLGTSILRDHLPKAIWECFEVGPESSLLCSTETLWMCLGQIPGHVYATLPYSEPLSSDFSSFNFLPRENNDAKLKPASSEITNLCLQYMYSKCCMGMEYIQFGVYETNLTVALLCWLIYALPQTYISFLYCP